MKRSAAIGVLAFAWLPSACAPMYMLGASPPHAPFAAVQQSPVGRWDAVMALESPALIGVVTSDGIAHTGRFAGAGMYWLRLFEKGSEVEFARDDVARVDYVGGAPSGTAQRVAVGAAAGAVAAGATEMFFALAFGGKLVLARRSLAVGAAGGAVAGAMDSAARAAPRAIYLSPQLVR